MIGIDSNYNNLAIDSNYPSANKSHLSDRIQNIWENIQEGVQVCVSKTCSLASKTIEYLKEKTETPRNYIHNYVRHRHVVHGLPLAVLSSAATAYLFSCANPLTGAIFGAVNYTLLTTLLEIKREFKHLNNKKHYIGSAICLFISYAVTTAFMKVVLKLPFSYLYAIPLVAAAALTGQACRWKADEMNEGEWCDGQSCETYKNPEF